MKLKNKIAAICLGLTALSCKQENQSTKTGQAEAKQTPLFSKGKKIESENFTGTAYLEMLVLSDSLNPNYIGNVTFEPGARTNWHIHPNGQILLVTNGKGFYQEKGSPIKTIFKGDVIKCTPKVEHWHGAASTEAMTHIAIGVNTSKSSVIWLQPVTDAEYQP